MIFVKCQIADLLKRGNFKFHEYSKYSFFYKFLKFYSKELAPGLRKFFRKNQKIFGHIIHQIYVEFPQDHKYAIQKNSMTNTSRVIAQKR